jgi:hypothetical protein
LRSKPESRIAAELHLACIESQEQKDAQHMKQVATGGAVAVAALGVVAGVASMMLSGKK